MCNKYLKSTIRSESGYASFVITFVTIIVVSLIVVAFATDSRLEQKNSLANNLAEQAYYAAESGINDALAVIDANPRNIVSTGNNCATGSPYISGSSNVLSNSAEYTCLIVNATPSSYMTPLYPGIGQTIPIKTSPINIKYITVSWEFDPGSGGLSSPTFTGCPDSGVSPTANLPPSTSYTPSSCSAGILQMDVISGTSLNGQLTSGSPSQTIIDNLITNTTTVYFEPTKSSSTNSGFTNGGVYYVHCPSTHGYYLCTSQIKVPTDATYYLHLQSFYMADNVHISVQQSKTGSDLPISDSQVLIDSTGSADGQLKRLEERVCDNSFCNNGAPTAAIQSTKCIDKQFPVYPSQPPSYNPASTPPAGC